MGLTEEEEVLVPWLSQSERGLSVIKFWKPEKVKLILLYFTEYLMSSAEKLYYLCTGGEESSGGFTLQ